jgi:hypothetical protein
MNFGVGTNEFDAHGMPHWDLMGELSGVPYSQTMPLDEPHMRDPWMPSWFRPEDDSSSESGDEESQGGDDSVWQSLLYAHAHAHAHMYACDMGRVSSERASEQLSDR